MFFIALKYAIHMDYSKEAYSKLFKLLLIGDSGVGKTSLLMRYTDDKFSGTFISTIGIDFRMKKIRINDTTIKLQIWDTAGQERFKTITSAYYRGAHAMIYVFDLSDIKTFKNIPTWISNVQSYTDTKNIKGILIGTKCDLPRAVPKDLIEKITKEHNIKYLETSSKTGYNVNEVFETITTELINDTPEVVKRGETLRLIETKPTPSSKCC